MVFSLDHIIVIMQSSLEHRSPPTEAIATEKEFSGKESSSIKQSNIVSQL